MGFRPVGLPPSVVLLGRLLIRWPSCAARGCLPALVHTSARRLRARRGRAAA